MESIETAPNTNNTAMSRMRLPTVDVQNCSDTEEMEEMLAKERNLKSPTVLTPPHSTPRSASPVVRSPVKSQNTSNPSTSTNQPKQYLQVGNPSSIFRLPKPQVSLKLSFVRNENTSRPPYCYTPYRYIGIPL